MMKRILFLLISLILTACGSDDEAPLPTVFSVDESAITQPPSNTPPEVSGAMTLPPTWTATLPPEDTETVTVTPSMTITDTHTPPPTSTASETVAPSGLLFLAQTAAFATPLPREMLPTSGPTPTGFVGQATVIPLATTSTPTLTTTCPNLAPGVFGQITLTDPTLAQQIGCPIGTTPVNRSAAVQSFENGVMIWLDDIVGHIYVLYDTGIFQRFDDTFDPSIDPESGGQTPPSGLFEPIRGFGKVWRSNPAVQNGLGWAQALEIGDNASTLDFTQGRMINLPSRGGVLVLISADGISGTWRAVQP